MNNPPLAAAHRAEVERPPGRLHALRRRYRAHAQLLDAQNTIVISVKAQQGMILWRHAKHFHGELFERKQQLRPVSKQEIDIGSGEPDHYVRVFQFRMGVLARGDLEI